MDELTPLVAGVFVGTVDASAAPTINLFVAPCKCRVVGVDMVVAAAKALHAADYGDYSVKNITDNVELASLSTLTGAADANALAADTAEAFTLTSTLANLELDAGDVLQFFPTEAGTATSGDLTECFVQVKWVPGTGAGR